MVRRFREIPDAGVRSGHAVNLSLVIRGTMFIRLPTKCSALAVGDNRRQNQVSTTSISAAASPLTLHHRKFLRPIHQPVTVSITLEPMFTCTHYWKPTIPFCAGDGLEIPKSR